MVTCAVFGCSNKSGKVKVSYSIPKIITGQGELVKALTTRHQLAWIKTINRKDLVGTKLDVAVLCGQHFVKGSY